MNEFDGYGEESPLKAEAGWSNGIGWGNGNAPGRGSQWCTGGVHYLEIPSPKPCLGKFLVYALCLIVLLLGLWMI
jgi:hypothetical protein